RGQHGVESAVVATKSSRREVHCQSGIAVRAWGDPTAGRAKKRWCITTSIEEYEHLAVFAQMPLHRLYCGRGYAGVNGIGAQIYQRHTWRFCASCPIGERQPRITSAFDVV